MAGPLEARRLRQTPLAIAMNTVFMGSGDIGIPALNWLLDSPDCRLQAVFTQPDRPSGRKLQLTPTAIKLRAAERGIPVHQPETLRSPAAFAVLEELAPDLIVVMAYGQILRQAVIDLPTIACINLHASLLPRHRGAAPIQAAILAGDAESGVTVMHIAAGLDTGDILLAEACPIRPADTGGELHDRLAGVAATALARAVPLLRDGRAPRTPQDPALATYSGKLSREDGHIRWTEPASQIERRLRAFHPWPGAFCWAGNRKLKLFPPARLVPESASGAAPGTILAADQDGLVVACGSGSLAMESVQLEGKSRLDIGAFLRGHANLLLPGQLLG